MRVRLALWLYRRAIKLAPEIAVAQERITQARIVAAIQARDAYLEAAAIARQRARAAQNN